jgi:hypothetical protein
MGLRWLLLAVLLAPVIPIHGQEKTSKAEKVAKKTKVVEQPSPSVVVTGNQIVAAYQTGGSKDQPKNYLERLFSPENLPSVALVIIGGFGLRAAFKTLKAIQRQADLMEAGFDQTVDVNNWQVSPPLGNRMLIRADVVNTSAFPITITEGYIEISSPAQPSCIKSPLRENTFIAARDKVTLEIVYEIGDLTSAPTTAFFTFGPSVKGSFSHRHRITNKLIIQPLVGRLTFGKLQDGSGEWFASFDTFIHLNPEVQKDSKPEQSEGR